MKGLIALVLSAISLSLIAYPAHTQTTNQQGKDFVLELDDAMLAELARRKNGLKSFLPNLQGQQFTRVFIKYIGTGQTRTTPKPRLFDVGTEASNDQSGLNSLKLPLDTGSIQALKAGKPLVAEIDPAKDIGVVKVVMAPAQQVNSLPANNTLGSDQFGSRQNTLSGSNPISSQPPSLLNTTPNTSPRNDQFGGGNNTQFGSGNRQGTVSPTQPASTTNPLPNNSIADNRRNVFPDTQLYPRTGVDNTGINNTTGQGNPNLVGVGGNRRTDIGTRADYSNRTNVTGNPNVMGNPNRFERRPFDDRGFNNTRDTRPNIPSYNNQELMREREQLQRLRDEYSQLIAATNRNRVGLNAPPGEFLTKTEADRNVRDALEKQRAELKTTADQQTKVALENQKTELKASAEKQIKEQVDKLVAEQANWSGPVLWFAFFVSFGLNMYLWWIWRASFTRYQELADDLRQTFSQPIN